MPQADITQSTQAENLTCGQWDRRQEKDLACLKRAALPPSTLRPAPQITLYHMDLGLDNCIRLVICSKTHDVLRFSLPGESFWGASNDCVALQRLREAP